MQQWQHIARAIGQASGHTFTPQRQRAVGGGCINQSWLIGDGQREYFVKLNDAAALEMFEAEADGLRELAAARAIRVPQPLVCGVSDGQAWLVMEALPLGGQGDVRQLGRQLAALHRVPGEGFGWYRDNTIGSTPQYNRQDSDWPTFWAAQRLGPQLQWAAGRGAGRLQQLGERLLEALPALFSGYRPQASLLHGDLWSGNQGWLNGGEPVLFDPAVYYGDREADLAMTELFGGFAADFYAAYREAWPLDAGYGTRKTLYNLYHVLNHYNLFGGAYAEQAQGMMQRLLSELS